MLYIKEFPQISLLFGSVLRGTRRDILVARVVAGS